MALLLAAGADPHRQVEDGTRALDWAAQEGHTAVLEQLLRHDPGLLELPGFRGRTALIAAAAGGHAGALELLLAAGADPRARLEDGMSALDLAAGAGHLAVVEALLRHDPGLLARRTA